MQYIFLLVSLSFFSSFTMAYSIQRAAKNGDIEGIQRYLDSGVSVDKQGFITREAALHLASRAGHLHVVKFLVEKGANMNIKNKGGANPIHIATWDNHEEIVRFLVESGADVDARNSWGQTPLQYYCGEHQDDITMVRFLIENGADVNRKDDHGRSPLGYAKKRGFKKITEYLQSKGAKI